MRTLDSSSTRSTLALRARRALGLTLSVAALSLLFAACVSNETGSTAAVEEAACAEEKATVDEHLATFDELDFDVFTNQKWDLLSHSHSKDIVVHWPDGHTTTGIDVHIADLKSMFVYAPDTRIEVHPIRIGQGEYTSVTGVMEGTFTEPMPLPDGSSIPPTGKAFKLTMATVGHWKDGVMDEEYLFWDNQTFMRQLGLAQ